MEKSRLLYFSLLFILGLLWFKSPFFAILFLAAIVVLFLSCTDLTLGLIFLFALVSFIPCDFMPQMNIQILGVVFNPYRVFALLIIFLFLMKNVINREPIFIKTPLNKYLILFPVILLIGLMGAERYGEGVQQLFGIILWLLICYFTMVQLSRTHEFIEIIKGIVIIGSCVGIYGIMEVVLGRNILLGRFYEVDAAHRISSTIGNAVYLGAYLVPLVPLSLFLSLGAFSRKRIFWVACSGVILISLFLTISRGSWICGLLVVLIYIKNKVKNVIFFSLLALLAVSVILTAFPSFVEVSKERSANVFKTGSFWHRYYAYEATFNILKDSPLLGLGLRNLQYSYSEYAEKGDPHGLRSHWSQLTMDNGYLQLFAETGLLGFFVFVFILFTLFRIIFQFMRKSTDKNLKDLLLALFASLIGVMLNQFTADTLFLTAPALMFWLLAAVTVAIKLGLERKEVGTLIGLE